MATVRNVARSERADDDVLGSIRALEDLPREHGLEPLEVEGTVPPGLEGTLYRAGAALFSAGGRRYDHLFDADGGLTAVRFHGGQVRGVCA